MKDTTAPSPLAPDAAARIPRRALRRALLIGLGALLVRTLYLILMASMGRTGLLAINLDPISDMEAFHRWAITIVEGDWLGRGDFHPFHPWQTAVAAREQWQAWYGHVYHQEPFYPYLVALVYLVAPRGPFSVILFQMLVGSAGCSLAYLAARRMFPEGAAVAAGVLSALYGPYVYYESLLLRDSFLIPLYCLLLWMVVEARARSDGGRATAWWTAAGGVAGVAYLTKATILPFVLLLAAWTFRERWRAGLATREALLPALAMTAGLVLAMAPVVGRNLVVGAPPLKITTRGPIELINGNNRWHPGIGWFDGDDRRVSEYARSVLARSGGRLGPTALAILSDWKSDPAGFVRLQLRKTAYFFAPFEMPNNASYSYFRLNSPLLRHATLSFFWISPLAAAGLIASWPRRRALMPLLLFLIPGILLTVAFYVIARFRAPLMPAVLMLAGAGLWSIIEALRRRRLAAGILLLLVASAGWAINAATDYPDQDLVRPQDYLISIEAYRSRGAWGPALAEAEEGRRIFPELALFHKEAAALYLDRGRKGEAARALRDALARDPTDAAARRELIRLEGGSSP